jgi:Tol biopolymer transport system component
MDAAIDGPSYRCDLEAPFSAAVPVPGINTTSEENGGWISSDGLRLYYALGAGGLSIDSRDIYTASRATIADPFGAPAQVPGVNSTTGDQSPSLTADELTIVFIRATTSDVYIATRADVHTSFGTPTPVTSIQLGYEEAAWISADGLTLYVASTSTGNFTFQIYMATRMSLSAAFGAPTLVSSLASQDSEQSPVVRGDGLEIFFASQRDSVMGPVGTPNNVWHAQRRSVTDPWDAPAPVTEVNGAVSNEGPTWVSGDGCELVFTSDRTDGAGSYDLWIASRPPP